MVLPGPDVMHLARVDRFPEFRRPMEIDRVGTDGPVGRGVGARVHVGFLDYHRGDFELAAYDRSPWARVGIEWKYAMTRLLASNAAQGASVGQSLEGTGIRLFGPSSQPTRLYNNTTLFGGTDFQLNYEASGPDAGAGFNPPPALFLSTSFSGPTYDDTLFRVTATASRLHTESAYTVFQAAIARSLWMSDNGVNGQFVTVERSIKTPNTIAPPKTISMAMTVQF